MIIFKHNTAIVTRPSQYVQAVKLASGRYTFQCRVKHFQNFLTIRIEGVSGTWYSFTVPCIAGGWALNNIANITFTLPERGKSFDMCADAGVSPSNPVYIQRLMLEEGDNVSTHRINEQDLDEQIDDSIEAATYWVIKTSSPVIYKDAPDAVTPGAHTPIVISGELRAGTKRTPGGKITVTPAGGEESAKFPSPYTLTPLDADQISDYTLKLYSEIDDSLLDEEIIYVVYKGATGVDAIVVDLSNDSDVLPADPAGNVTSYIDSGTRLKVMEGVEILNYDGQGTQPGTYRVITTGTNITPDTLPSLDDKVIVFGDASAMTSDRASIMYRIEGTTFGGDAFVKEVEQRFTIAKTGATGDPGTPGSTGNGILKVTEFYLATNLATGVTHYTTGWKTDPSQAVLSSSNKYLWNYESVTYTDGSYINTSPVIIGVYGDKGDKGDPGTPGSPGLPGQITIQKEWKPGDVHRNDDYIIDFIYVRAANKTDRKFYKLKSGYTSRTVPAGETIPSTSTLDTYYDEVAWMLALALKFLIAEEGNFANFIFKDQKLVSLRGTVNGAAVDYDAISDSDRAIFQPNIIIDGKNGEITAAGGKVKFRFDGSGFIANHNIEWDALGNTKYSGALKGVSGSFKTLTCVDNDGNEIGKITFGSNGRIWFEGCTLFHQAPTGPFYMADAWVRGVLGVRARTALVISGTSYGHVYKDGLDGSSQYVALTSGIDSSGNTYYNIPLYSPTSESSGMPVDLVIINHSNTARYCFPYIPGKTIHMVGSRDQNSNIYVYFNGVATKLLGGSGLTAVCVGSNQYPDGTTWVGRGWQMTGLKDNQWT